MLSVHQRHRRTDGQTDGRTTYDSNTALALRASRGKNAGASASRLVWGAQVNALWTTNQTNWATAG